MKVGDVVGYTRRFVQAIRDQSHADLYRRRGTVLDIIADGKQVGLVRVRWHDDPNQPRLMLAQHVEAVSVRRVG